ncbi:MAG: Yip1 family protein [Micavibrio sp.]|nr:Yip1 family protein [Micavibrio sp.]
MSVTNDARINNIIERAKNIILKPAAEWDKIAGEAASIKGLYLNYAIILAAIPAVCSFVGMVLFLHAHLVGALGAAITTYVMSLAAVGVLGFVVSQLAPKLQGDGNQEQAFKLAIYSSTPGWIAGVLWILPSLGGLAGLGALYGLYLFYIGVPKLAKVPQSNAVIMTVVALVVTAVVMAVGMALAR